MIDLTKWSICPHCQKPARRHLYDPNTNDLVCPEASFSTADEMREEAARNERSETLEQAVLRRIAQMETLSTKERYARITISREAIEQSRNAPPGAAWSGAGETKPTKKPPTAAIDARRAYFDDEQ